MRGEMLFHNRPAQPRISSSPAATIVMTSQGSLYRMACERRTEERPDVGQRRPYARELGNAATRPAESWLKKWKKEELQETAPDRDDQLRFRQFAEGQGSAFSLSEGSALLGLGD